MATRAQQAEQQVEAKERLRELLPAGSTVHTILRHVSTSGMTRHISCVVVGSDGEVNDITWLVGRALGHRQNPDHGGVVMGGCGMDMGFALVYALYPDGYGCVGEGCPANDHANGDRDHTPHSNERSHWHRDGGYAIRQRWL